MIENENAKFMKEEQFNSKECSFVVWKNTKFYHKVHEITKFMMQTEKQSYYFFYKIIYSDECTLPLIILLGQLKGQDINKVNHLPHL